MEGGDVRKAGRGRKKKETVRPKKRSENVNDDEREVGRRGEKGVGRKRKGGLEMLCEMESGGERGR